METQKIRFVVTPPVTVCHGPAGLVALCMTKFVLENGQMTKAVPPPAANGSDGGGLVAGDGTPMRMMLLR